MTRTGAATVAATLALGFLTAACSQSHDTAADDDDDAVAGTSRTPTASGSETEADTVARDLVDLLAAYDAAVNEIAADPGLAADTGSSAVQDLQVVFTEDNELVAGMLATWTSQADSDLTIRPYGDEHGSYTSVLVEAASLDSDDEVSFKFCSEERYRVHQGDVVVDVVPFEVFEGQATAVREEGRWLLDEVQLSEGSGSCEAEEGS